MFVNRIPGDPCFYERRGQELHTYGRQRGPHFLRKTFIQEKHKFSRIQKKDMTAAM